MLTFGDFPGSYRDYKNSRIVLVPVPYDGTSTWMKGAHRGPGALLAASYYLENYDIETDFEVYRKGIAVDLPVEEDSSPEEMARAVEARVGEHLGREKFPVVLGGEHSVSIGAALAHSKKYGGLSVLQLDAHADLRNSYEGSRYNHACVTARIREACPVVQAGVRSLDIVERDAMDRGKMFFAEEMMESDAWMDAAVSALSDTVYVTIDLDVFDISIMRATGTPEPGGLGWYQVIRFLKKVCGEKRITGFDIVELCPGENTSPEEYLAAKLLYKTLSYIFVRDNE